MGAAISEAGLLLEAAEAAIAAEEDELLPDLGDDLAVTLIFFTVVGFLMVTGLGVFKSPFAPRVLDEGEPLELRVEPTSRPTDLFKGLLLLLPALARCWRPLLDILLLGVGRLVITQ